MLSKPTSFVKPRYEGHSIANIPESVFSLLGGNSERGIRDERMREFADGTDNVVLLLLDGLGLSQLNYSRSNCGLPSFDHTLSKSIQFPITSVFPSTTSSAMTSLHTGLTPQEHGIIGYTMFLSEIGVIAQMLRFAPIQGGRSLFDYGIDVETFAGAETIHERLESSGQSSTVYVPRYIIDSGLSRITYRGARIEPQNSFADMMVKVRKNLESEESHSSFHFAYHPSPDTITHSLGTYSEEYAAELESILHMVDVQLFQRLEKRVAKKTVFMLSGDHGAVTVHNQEIVDVSSHSDLLSCLKLPPTGDSRAAILHLKSGKQERVRRFFEENYPSKFEVRDSSAMLSEGYFGFGKAKKETSDRIGDLIVLPKYYNAIDNSVVDPRYDEVPGRHGGLSEEEMNVPFVISRLA